MPSAEAPLLMRRRGFTLLELAVVLAIVGVLGSTIGLVLLRQQRFYRGTSELITTRESVRDAIEVLSADIRGMSVADTARLLADSAIEFFSTIGSSIVCQSLATSEIGLPALAGSGTLEAGSGGLTSFATQPDTGDLALFYVDSGPAELRWRRSRIAAFSSRSVSTACPPSTVFFSAVDAASGAKAFAVTLRDPLSPAIHPGSPIRFIRRGRYSLYRASDGSWYLGYRRCNAIGASVCGSVQPLSGPYRSYSRDTSRSGLVFEYFDRSGGQLLGSPLSLARVDITARAASRQSLLREARNWTPSDSAHVSVAIRNRL